MYIFFKYNCKSDIFFIVVSAMIFFAGCGGKNGGGEPIKRIKASLIDASDYSIILEDMKKEGNFISKYFHKYGIVEGEQSNTTNWLNVSEKFYKTNEGFLGMTLAAKKDGKIISSIAPPGYQYVDDSRYGRWRNNDRGGSFWEFYGKYALFSTLLGGFHRPIYRNDYNLYSQHRNRNVPYFGMNKEYGTNGSFTKKNRPNFYSRNTQRTKAKSISFKEKVAKKTGRTRTGFRSRAGGFGK